MNKLNKLNQLDQKLVASLTETTVNQLLASDFWRAHYQRIQSLLKIAPRYSFTLNDGIPQLAATERPQDETFQQDLYAVVKSLTPWRVGPIKIDDLFIESEWDSRHKWNRLEPALCDLPPAPTCLDIGHSSGYFMLRLQSLNPKIVIGIDPLDRCWLQIQLLKGLLQNEKLLSLPLRMNELNRFEYFFDLALCLGVLYHLHDPIRSLRRLKTALKPNGKAIFETLVIAGDASFSISPRGRFMGMHNVFFVPTLSCVVDWLTKAGFSNVKLINQAELNLNEQSSTKFAPNHSLINFINEERQLTAEGYPLPTRATFLASNA